MLNLKKGAQLADRYSLIQRLGGGGQAEVWLAKDRLTGASVALKASTERQTLRSEWQLGIRLMHAHIVRAFEFHEESEFSIFSRQFVDGPNISELGQHPLAEILAPFGLVADALRYVHAKGFVHRDVKASNILLDPHGAPYLIDFGIACEVGQASVQSSGITATPQTLAGESAQCADDVFALGGLLYELLTGQSAYSSARLLDDIRQSVPLPVQLCNGEKVPPEITTLLAAMLHKDAARRPTAELVVADLKKAGFQPGASKVRSAARMTPDTAKNDEIVAPVRNRRSGADRQARRDTTQRDRSDGIGRLGAVFGLVALLSVLVGVIFFLPNGLQESADSDVAVSVENDEGASSDSLPIETRETRTLLGEEITFSENSDDLSGLNNEGLARLDAEVALGELLSALQVLEGRAADRWAPTEYRESKDLYAAGDKAYLEKDFTAAKDHYVAALAVLQPLYDRIEPTFQQAYADAVAAFDAGKRLDSLRFYELAVAITPSHRGAIAGYERAKNLEAVLSLVEQGEGYERDLELEAAERSFERAVDIDSVWEPAIEGLRRVRDTRTKMAFDIRMSDGFAGLADADYLAARAAFRVAQKLIPTSTEPADGLLQVEQALRLQDIQTLEQEALSLEADEHWDAVVQTYEEILKVDATLSFASEGLSHAKSMSALHSRLDALIAEPDKLSAPQQMQNATQLVVAVTTRQDVGPRLAGQRDELSRLLRRAATPLSVPLISDNVTQVTIYRVGQLGSFAQTEVSLRPGTYVAVGVRPGYRDVREEFRVAPEVTMEPVVVRCEERI